MFGLIAALAFGLVTAQTESVGGSEEEVYSVSAFIYENGDLKRWLGLSEQHPGCL